MSCAIGGGLRERGSLEKFHLFPSCMKEAIFVTLGRKKNLPYTYSKTQKTAPDSRETYLQVVCLCVSPVNALRALPAETSFSTKTFKYSEFLGSPKAVACAGSPVGRAWAEASTSFRAVSVHKVTPHSAKIRLKPGSGFWLY